MSTLVIIHGGMRWLAIISRISLVFLGVIIEVPFALPLLLAFAHIVSAPYKGEAFLFSFYTTRDGGNWSVCGVQPVMHCQFSWFETNL